MKIKLELDNHYRRIIEEMGYSDNELSIQLSNIVKEEIDYKYNEYKTSNISKDLVCSVTINKTNIKNGTLCIPKRSSIYEFTKDLKDIHIRYDRVYMYCKTYKTIADGRLRVIGLSKFFKMCDISNNDIINLYYNYPDNSIIIKKVMST